MTQATWRSVERQLFTSPGRVRVTFKGEFSSPDLALAGTE